ncbi:caspase family protein [Calothrix sp. FACHB-156]|nr:caspase family protein [Calothrix sp. FACHB-156]
MTPRSPRQSLRAIFTVGFFTAISLTLFIPFLASNQAKSQTFSPAPNLLAVTNQKRVALVIGNSNYQVASALANPGNDAEDVAKTLGELGFEVIKVIDGNQKQMDTALERFSAKLSQGTVGVFYYAGHGVQVNGENYLIPINAQLAAEQDVAYETLPVGKVQNAMEKTGTTSIIILDACRDNPFSRKWYRTTNSARGLAPVEAFSSSYIAFATAPGSVAADGKGRNGTFTSYLLKHLKTPNIPIENLFKTVRNEVLKATRGKQKPWDSSSLTDEFFFNPVSTTTTRPTPILSVKPPTNPAEVTPVNRSLNFVSKLTPYPSEKISLAYTFKDKHTYVIGLSSNGETLATKKDKVIEIWNLTTKNKVNTLPYKLYAEYHLSPDGKNLVEIYGKEVKILDLVSGKILHNLVLPQVSDIGSTISPDGKTLAIFLEDGTIRTLNLMTGKFIQTISGRCGNRYSPTISYDGTALAIPCKDSIKIWNLETGKLKLTLPGHSDQITSLAISRDGKNLVSISDTNIKIWNLATGKLVGNLANSQRANLVQISPDMKTIITSMKFAPGGIQLWDMNTWQLIYSLENPHFNLIISDDSKTILILSLANIDVWKLL